MRLHECLFVLLCVAVCSTAYDLGGVISGNRMGAVPLGRTFNFGELDVEGICSSPGFTCQSCTQAVTCVELPVGWLKVPLQQCPEDQTCNAHKRACSSDSVPECDVISQKYDHVCEQVGIFPDAFDCRKFHLCSPPAEFPSGRPAEHRPALCPRHYGYDPHTAQCSIKLQNSQCDSTPVPRCNHVGQSEALASSPNHYYVCLSRDDALHPQIFICPHGWFYYDGFCRPEPKTVKKEDNVRKPETNNRDEKLEVVGIKDEGAQKKGKSLDEKELNEAIDTTSKEAKTREAVTTEAATTETVEKYRGLSFFSTEKATTYAPDTFLADKYDLTHLEMDDDSNPQTFGSYEIDNPFDSDVGIVD